MIVDTSAIVAIWRREPLAEALSETLLQAPRANLSAPTYVEIGCVLDDRSRPEANRRLDALLDAYGIETIPFTAEHARLARAAYRDFGKGSGHPARLNLGDCFSYALAAATGEDLLFVGDDFTHTDLEAAPLASPGAGSSPPV
ncbi:MAG: type II toxin-antitoxin system VapC family toxin [Bifidobacteriaceae bacterium]|jgi:ribonuclease VapC|nr:type II toxin-antitoxin system VapC family toxin [Bifidobacteriaceae bacterium]